MKLALDDCMFVSKQGLVGLIAANGGTGGINLPELDPPHKFNIIMENQYGNKCCVWL